MREIHGTKVGLFRQRMCGALLQMAGKRKEELVHLGQHREVTFSSEIRCKKLNVNAALNLHNVPLFLAECHHVSWFMSVCLLFSNPPIPQQVSSMVYIVVSC